MYAPMASESSEGSEAILLATQQQLVASQMLNEQLHELIQQLQLAVARRTGRGRFGGACRPEEERGDEVTRANIRRAQQAAARGD